jgi:hypothetical protein
MKLARYHSALFAFLTLGATASTSSALTIAPGYYKIVNMSSGKVLGVSGCSTNALTFADQYPYTGAQCQQWDITVDPATGEATLLNTNSEMVLGIRGCDPTNLNFADQYPDHGWECQRWNLLPAGDGTYFIQNRSTYKYLGIQGCSSADFTYADQYDLINAPCQHWSLQPLSSNVTMLSDGTVSILCAPGNHVASAFWYNGDTTTLGVQLDGATYTFAMNPWFGGPAPTSILFNGNQGDDNFTNNTSLPSVAHGGAGNDTLVGGSAVDHLYGDDGNDSLSGNADNDFLFGGSGVNSLDGGSGQDTLISVGFGADTVHGGSGLDYFWAGTTDVLPDVDATETSLGYLHRIGAFQSISYNGGNTSTPIGLNPSGGFLPNPQPMASDSAAGNVVIETFSDHPTFRPTGPNKDDAFQSGALGDCYFISDLAAMADAHPDYIRNMVADLGDSTYAVRFYSNGSPIYYRVDSELWANKPDPRTPRYATFDGAPVKGAGTMWAEIIEKAYAFARNDNGIYDAIASGNSDTATLVGFTVTNWVYPDGYSMNGCDAVCTATQNWAAQGQPAGTFSTNLHNYVDQFLLWVQTKRAANESLLCGAKVDASDTSSLSDPNNWRNPEHIYMIDSVTTGPNGKPNGIVIRNPFGKYVTLQDYARIYYLIGGANWMHMSP